LALVTTEFVRKEVRWQMIKSIGGSVLLNLALSTFAEFNNAAHLGGLFAGLISGYLVWVIYKIIPRYKEVVFVLLLCCAIISLFIFVLPKIPKTSILLNALSERIELLKRETTIQIDKELRKNQFEEKDTTFYIQKWNVVGSKIDSLKLFEQHELIDKYIVLQIKELKLRKRETSLIISVNSGNKTKIIPLKKVQEQLQAMSNPQ
ncbi:MAG: hypothetical protein ACK452_10895, partial [Bacteroidota bacterium]